MNIGTRVVHLRYGWMVGHIVEKRAFGHHVMVLWDHIGGPCAELPQDLRATPIQP